MAHDGNDRLDELVAEARSSYAARRPESARLAARAADVLPGGSTRSVLDFAPFPFRVAHAGGARLTDVDGHTYLDLLGDYSAGLLGHRPEAVRHAVRGALELGWSYGATHRDEIRLAELVCERFPAIDRVRFTNSGTEANLMAVNLARHATGRDEVLVFDGAYHGGLLYFGVGGEALLAPFRFHRCSYNDLDSVERTLAEHGDRIALALVEPMLGAGGCIAAQPGFLEGLRAACTRHGVLLCFDEVMTSRMSAGGAQQRLGIRPDLTTLGKYLAGGLTFGAFGGRADLLAAFDPAAGGTLTHGGTFNNNPVSMAAGVAALEHELVPERLDELFATGEELRLRLDAELAATGLTATGWGSLIGLHPTRTEITRPEHLRAIDARLRELLFFGVLERGCYFAPRGYVALSLALTANDLDRFVDAVVDVAADLPVTVEA
ncbi:MAG: aminotransferase class III-fold pyridoxal phosphate-dependent enzyme [Actinomycetota bacterium]